MKSPSDAVISISAFSQAAPPATTSVAARSSKAQRTARIARVSASDL